MPPLLGWPVLFGWMLLRRPVLFGWRPLLLGRRPLFLGWRPPLLGWSLGPNKFLFGLAGLVCEVGQRLGEVQNSSGRTLPQNQELIIEVVLWVRIVEWCGTHPNYTPFQTLFLGPLPSNPVSLDATRDRSRPLFQRPQGAFLAL